VELSSHKYGFRFTDNFAGETTKQATFKMTFAFINHRGSNHTANGSKK